MTRGRREMRVPVFDEKSFSHPEAESGHQVEGTLLRVPDGDSEAKTARRKLQESGVLRPHFAATHLKADTMDEQGAQALVQRDRDLAIGLRLR